MMATDCQQPCGSAWGEEGSRDRSIYGEEGRGKMKGRQGRMYEGGTNMVRRNLLPLCRVLLLTYSFCRWVRNVVSRYI